MNTPSIDVAHATSLASVEARHLDHVPPWESHGRVWRQAPFWFLGNFQPFTVAIAFVGPALGLSGLWTSVAGITGIFFGALFMAAHAAQGPALGLPQMIQSRAQFGYRGVVVPVFATTLTFIGFNVVTVVIVKEGLFNLLGWNTTGVTIGISLAAALLAIYGHDWIHRIVSWVFLVSLPLWMILTLGVMTGRAGGHGQLIGNFNAAGFFIMFSVAASYNITYAPCVSDYSRYLPRTTSRRSITTAVVVGAVGSPVWLIPLGAWMATRLHVSDALSGIYLAGNNTISHEGTVLTLAAVLALVATMSISAYSGMLSVLTIIDSFRPIPSGSQVRIVTILGLALAWVILGSALTNATSVLNDWLLLMLYLLAPWTSVNLVDFYFVRHGRFAITELFTPSGIYGRWGQRGITAYFVGIAVEIPFVSVPGLYVSPGATWLGGVDVSWLLGLLVAGGVYIGLSRSLDYVNEEDVVNRSEVILRASEFAMKLERENLQSSGEGSSHA